MALPTLAELPEDMLPAGADSESEGSTDDESDAEADEDDVVKQTAAKAMAEADLGEDSESEMTAASLRQKRREGLMKLAAKRKR